MKFLKGLLIVVAVLAVILVIVGFLLPQKVQVERSITISATKDTVFNQVNNLQNFNSWSPWAKMDPNASYSYTGPMSGVGATMTWDSQVDSVGSGAYRIIESNYPNLVKVEITFGQDPNPGYATYMLEDAGEGQTELTWRFDADFGNNLIGRYMGLMMDSMLGPQYEQGLNNLKRKIEG